jgi:ribosome-associated heat shock protein Hsp15
VSEGAGTVRIDKWLWAARFFKTRSLAAEAIDGGHVQVNGVRAKPSRGVRIGETITLRKGPYEFVVIVRGVSDRRGPAPEAQALYEETEASRRRREEVAEKYRFASMDAPAPERRPDKRDRRRIIRFVDKGR